MNSLWLYYDFKKHGTILDGAFENVVPKKFYEGSGTDFIERDISWGGMDDVEAYRYKRALLARAKELDIEVRVEVV